ncbi:MAG TPA: flavin reductase family protein [Ktedonobacteraceae bacterium]|nr:flavin reductase family protein [Ktedonobacteraceae bacterium]
MDSQLKKQVLRTFTYGLYAISCANEGEINAFTANWLSQVSFEPPMVAVSVENNTKSLPMIQRSRKFIINVFRSDGQDEKRPNRLLTANLGKSALKYPEKLANIPYTPGYSGAPILTDALAWVACDVKNTVETGDSTLVIAEVVDVGMLGEGQPMTMNEAGFKHAG